VLLHERSGKLYLHSDGSGGVNAAGKLTLADTRKLLGNAVTISHHTLVRHFTTQKPPASWQKNALLRFHRLVRLDDQGQVQVGKYILRLDPELGVVIRKADNDRDPEP
jgi:hypothetical protein